MWGRRQKKQHEVDLFDVWELFEQTQPVLSSRIEDLNHFADEIIAQYQYCPKKRDIVRYITAKINERYS